MAPRLRCSGVILFIARLPTRHFVARHLPQQRFQQDQERLPHLWWEPARQPGRGEQIPLRSVFVTCHAVLHCLWRATLEPHPQPGAVRVAPKAEKRAGRQSWLRLPSASTSTPAPASSSRRPAGLPAPPRRGTHVAARLRPAPHGGDGRGSGSSPHAPDTEQYVAVSPGVGKSHIAVALGREAVRQGYSVLFTSAMALITDLVKAQAEGRLEEKLTRYVKPKLL